LSPTKWTEYDLTANQKLADVSRLKWNTNSSVQSEISENFDEIYEDSSDFKVLLNPMEIRTFTVEFDF